MKRLQSIDVDWQSLESNHSHLTRLVERGGTQQRKTSSKVLAEISSAETHYNQVSSKVRTQA